MAEMKLLEKIKDILAGNVTRVDKATQIAEAIREEGAFRWVGLYDVDTQNGLVSNVAWSGPSAPAYPTFAVTKGLTSRAVAERTTINVGDVANDPHYLIALHTTRSEIIVPVLDAGHGRVVGTIDVESAHLNAFDSRSQAVLEACARLLADFFMRD
jgi:putative methionine-R-sulfoxide reductase with GAF domain